jgi:transglutaminase-like putative cysteine protease
MTAEKAAVMTAMLRSLKIPCKLVIGYAGVEYHAWINVYSEDSGWMDGVVFFDGKTWRLLDPTFASGGASEEYIDSKVTYSAKYLY